jgi:hypothetical protein
MTCIVGLEHDGKVYLAGDSAGVAGLSIHTRQDEKVFTNGDMVMGFTSSFRMGQLLRYEFEPPDHSPKKNDMAYLVGPFVDKVRECFKTNGFMHTTERGEEYGGTFLLGYRGGLYVVDEDFQIGRTHDGYGAVGCGWDIALGSLYTSRPDPDPVRRLNLALEAASHFSAGVRAPFNHVRSE